MEVESSKKLVWLYVKFFNEQPDFNRKDIQRKAMAMVHLLWEYSVYLPCATSFHLSNKNANCVWSFAVEQLFSSCESYMEDRNDFLVEEFSWSISFAEILGKVVNCYLPNKDFELEFLNHVSTILFLRNHSLGKVSADDYLSSNYVCCQSDELQIIFEMLQYLDALRDYVCAIGKENKNFKILHPTLEEDTIIQKVELLLSKKKK